ncbi:MAG: hypothetical protein IPG53_03390 [Ignavibacteriales bacterium]|nr:hypothetical protein [Ignavibacteriales bacterium]
MYSTTKTGTVSIYFGAGEGTLLKIEPTIQSGGTLVTNDSLGSVFTPLTQHSWFPKMLSSKLRQVPN